MVRLAGVTPHILLTLLWLFRLRRAGLAWIADRRLHGSCVRAAGAGVRRAAFVDLGAGRIGGGGGLGARGRWRGWLEWSCWRWRRCGRGLEGGFVSFGSGRRGWGRCLRRTEGAGNGCDCDAAAGRLDFAEELERHGRICLLV